MVESIKENKKIYGINTNDFTVDKLTYLSLNVSVLITARLDISDSWQPAFRLQYGKEQENLSSVHAKGEPDFILRDGKTANLVIPFWRKFKLYEPNKMLTIKLFDAEDNRNVQIGEISTSISELLNAECQVFMDVMKLKHVPVGNITIKTDINTAFQTTLKFGFIWKNVSNMAGGFLKMRKKRKAVRFKVIRPEYSIGLCCQPEEVLWESDIIKKQESSDFDFSDLALNEKFNLKRVCCGDLDRKVKF